MNPVFIFAGTTEGRELCEILSDSGFDCTVSVATEYGESLLPKKANITILHGRMNSSQMIASFSQKKYGVVVDATHPFATEVSKEIRKACNYTKITYLRLSRDTSYGNLIHNKAETVGCSKEGPGKQDDLLYFSGISTAAVWLESQKEKIFISTGSKELPELCEKISDKSRLFVRVLPSIESLQICNDCKIPQRQIIAMQGPFSEKANEIQFSESGTKILLTKESGKAGGFIEKIRAAQKLGMKIAVIRNPESFGENADKTEIFHSVEGICDIIKNLYENH